MQSLQKRIIKGLANKHFSANMKAQGIQLNQTQDDILEKRKVYDSLGRTYTAKQGFSDI